MRPSTRRRPAPLLLGLAALLLAGTACRDGAAGGAGEGSPASAADPRAAEHLDPPAAPGALAPHLATDGEGFLLSWLEPMPEGRHRLRLARLDGDAWSRPVTVAEGDRFFANWADTPSVVAGRGGALLAHWLEKLGGGTYAYGVRVARSDDAGATWHDPGWLHADASATEHGFVSLVPTAAGFEAVWLDGRAMVDGGPMGLRWARLDAAGGAPEGEALLDERVCDCCQTAAVATPAGLVVAYRDRSPEEVRDISVIRHVAGVWSPPQRVAADGWTIYGCPVNGPALAADRDRVAVAWFTAADGQPRVLAALSGDAAATFSPPVTIDAAAPLGRVGVAPLAGGGAVVSWLAADGAVRLRRLDEAGAVGEPSTVGRAGASRAGGVPRLAAAGDGLAVAWRETEGDGPGRLRLARVPLAAVPGAP